ncbi:MAG: hypothetical protein E7576_11570 [Ruminococcaceae bacterium]|nr:hypothetical protein [Oscillospiraceae bacterium]
MTSKLSRILAILLCLAMTLPLAACSQGTDNAADDTGTVNEAANATAAGDVEAEAAPEEEEEFVDHRFDGVNYDGRSFRIQSSADSTDATNANEFIEGSGSLNGEIVNDAVFERNAEAEELLNIKLEFTQSDYTYSNAESSIRTFVMAGDDLYDLIINDDRSLIALTDENIFYNLANHGENFDLTRSYWYTDTMDDLVLVPGHSYVMAGDFFLDCLASAHCLFYNKQLCENAYGDPEYLDNIVLEGGWTYDKMTQTLNENYVDLNGDGVRQEGDQFGMYAHDYWGCLIAFVGSAGIDFIDRSGDEPVISFNNDRSVAYAEALNTLYRCDGNLVGIKESSDMNMGLRNLFGNKLSLICLYQRLNDLSKMREFEFDVGPIPYPKLYETDKYFTSIHDTTEMGAIPITSPDINFDTVCIEVLSRETAKGVIPVYYDQALKTKYSADLKVAQMIDLIHDNFGSSFVLCYNQALGDSMLQMFTDLVGADSTDFASAYKRKEKVLKKMCDKMVNAILANDEG